LSSSTIHNLTFTLILHPIAAGLSGLAVLFGLCGAEYHRSGTVLMALSSSLAALVTFVAFVLDLVLFSIARHEFRKLGWSSQYGNAIWLTLGALAALSLGFCTSTFGIFGSYRRRRYDTY
jgi:SUR7/PalI family